MSAPSNPPPGPRADDFRWEVPEARAAGQFAMLKYRVKPA